MTTKEAKRLALNALKNKQVQTCKQEPPNGAVCHVLTEEDPNAPILGLARIREPEPQNGTENFLNEEDSSALILNLARTREADGFNEDEIAELLNDAIATRISGILLDLAIKGIVCVNIDLTRAPKDRVLYHTASEYLSRVRRHDAANPLPG
jgi:hypothetical protein